jgi:hypothetical protein
MTTIRLSRQTRKAQDAFDQDRSAFGEKSEESIRSLDALVIAYQRDGDSKSALVLAKKLLFVSAALYGPNSRGALYAKARMGRVLLESGGLDEANVMLADALTMARNLTGDDGEMTLGVLCDLMKCMIKTGLWKTVLPISNPIIDARLNHPRHANIPEIWVLFCLADRCIRLFEIERTRRLCYLALTSSVRSGHVLMIIRILGFIIVRLSAMSIARKVATTPDERLEHFMAKHTNGGYKK